MSNKFTNIFAVGFFALLCVPLIVLLVVGCIELMINWLQLLLMGGRV